jgi:predicted nucleic acid-binding protein
MAFSNNHRCIASGIYLVQLEAYQRTWLRTRLATWTISVAAVGSWLLDTGPLVALLSRDDAKHAACVEAFECIRGQALTTEPVLTEAMHLLRRSRGATGACFEFFVRGGALLVPLTTGRLRQCSELTVRYADTPMDFADASLVTLANEFALGRILTLDRRGFETYRWRRTKAFTIAP